MLYEALPIPLSDKQLEEAKQFGGFDRRDLAFYTQHQVEVELPPLYSSATAQIIIGLSELDGSEGDNEPYRNSR